jgi:hypothetical protein
MVNKNLKKYPRLPCKSKTLIINIIKIIFLTKIWSWEMFNHGRHSPKWHL